MYQPLDTVKRPISPDAARIADISKHNNVIYQYLMTLNKTCYLIKVSTSLGKCITYTTC